MHRTAISLALALAMVLAIGSVAHAQVTETYVFRDTLAPSEGAGNLLAPVYNGTGTILTSGAGFIDGAFVTHTISPSACPSSPTVRAWAFPVSGGLRHPNTTPIVVTGSYSISMLMRYNPMDAGYARLVDFSGSTSDNGIYKLGAGVSFYPVGTFAAGSFIADQDVFVTITRDAASQVVSLFINGLAAGTYADTGGLYASASSVMYFLMDNTTGAAAISETDAGVISYLQLRDTPMTPAEVAASLAAICDTVACGDGMVDADEECDDGGIVDGDGCSYKCMLEPGFVCSGAPSTCTRTCGNGALDGDEACDDGANVGGDGCTPGCVVEAGYVCTGAPSVCMAPSTCAATEYESAPATSTMDRVCTPLTVCAATEYESTAATATSDRECSACTVCGPGMVEVSACASAADRVCAAGPDTGSADAGVGGADTGSADAGSSIDASPRGDAGVASTARDGGCGCAIVGAGSQHGGLGLLALAFVLFTRRRARSRNG